MTVKTMANGTQFINFSIFYSNDLRCVLFQGESDLVEDTDGCSSTNCDFADFESHESAR